MAIQKTRAFVLRREEIRETSILLTVYSRDFGKLKLLSKGARSPEQRYLSAYELFALDEIVFYEKKKKNLFLLSQCELVDYFPKIRESLERLSYATYFIELLDFVTTSGDKSQSLYGLLHECLNLLSGRASPKRVARIFEIKILSALGFGPRLKSCVNCDRKTEKDNRPRLSLKLGGVLCANCLGRDRNARSVLPGTVNFIASVENLPFDRAKQIKVANKVGSEVERLLKSFINYHLDVRPRSMEFITKVGM